MEVLQLIISALIALFVLVTFHEFGHYWVARRCGVRVLRFSIGFGTPLLKWRRGETEFAFSAIPLGGYVKMLGETREEDDEPIPEADRHLSFAHKSVWQRIAIVLAGPVANLILAFVLYWMFFLGGVSGSAPVLGEVEPGSIADQAGLQSGMEIVSVDGEAVDTWRDTFNQLLKRMGETGEIRLELQDFESASGSYLAELSIEKWQGDTGEPDILGSLGITPYTPADQPVVGEVINESAAMRAGLVANDRVLEISGASIESWTQMVGVIRGAAGRHLSLLIERNGERLMLELVPDSRESNDETIGYAGISLWPADAARRQSFSPMEAAGVAFERTRDMCGFVFDTLGKLVTGQLSTKSLGGPVTIAQVAGASAEAGWQSFIEFLAVMSVMLGVMNLLPIPVLDGGHLVFYAIEALKGSPLSNAIQNVAMRAGMTIVFGIMLLALYNDFARL